MLPVPSAFPEYFNFEDIYLQEATRACELEAVWLDEPVFLAGLEGVDDVIVALKKRSWHKRTNCKFGYNNLSKVFVLLKPGCLFIRYCLGVHN